jgi:hypothetical protein
MPKLKTYDPSQVSVILGGSIIGSWNTVAIAMDEDKFLFASDTSSGEATRTKNANTLGTYTLTLPQASEDNATLSALLLSDALVVCSIKDNGGDTIAVMPLGTVMKSADSEFGRGEGGEREWVIKGNIDVYFVGGNS